MKTVKYFIATCIVLLAACTDDSKLPYNYKEQVYGAYANVISVESGSFLAQNAPGFPLNAAISNFKLTIEARDVKKGGLLDSYEFLVSFQDNNAPILTKPEASVLEVPASAFSKDPDTGYPRATITIQSAAVLTALGLTESQVNGGDAFVFRHVLKLTDGREFTEANTNQVVTGGAFFNSPMRNNVSVLCPSDLVGTYGAVTDWIDYYGYPGSDSYTASITAAAGTGQYNIADLSGGMEPIIWGNPAVAAVFEDVCGNVNLVSAPYAYGYLINGPANSFGNTSNVNPATGVITIYWENIYGEHGRTILTPP